jgi:hypothetical protein
MENGSFGLSIFFILHPLAFGALISAQYFRNSHHEGSKARRNFHKKSCNTQPHHSDPFSGGNYSAMSLRAVFWRSNLPIYPARLTAWGLLRREERSSQ